MNDAPNSFYTILKRIGAIGGMLSGLILLVTSVALMALAFFEKNNFDKAEELLIVFSLILLGTGTHCLDLLEKERNLKRISC